MAKYYYNGVLLPEIPADVLASNPYCFIRENKTTGYYDLTFANDIWYLRNDGALTHSTSKYYPHYRLPIESAVNYEEWEYYQTTPYPFSIDDNRPILWANHDIPNGSAGATDIYFKGSEPVPEGGAVIDIQYSIYASSLTAIGNAIRGKTGKTELLTLDSMVTEINSIETGSSSNASMFASNASGTLPTVYRGTANSAFTLEFESSATGALQEG